MKFASEKFNEWASHPLFGSSVSASHDVAIALLAALGLDSTNVTRVEFIADVNEPAGFVKVERLVTTANANELKRVATKYTVCAVTSEPVATTVLEREKSQRIRRFECWLRDMSQKARGRKS